MYFIAIHYHGIFRLKSKYRDNEIAICRAIQDRRRIKVLSLQTQQYCTDDPLRT